MRGNLRADEKNEIIDKIYRLPNRILFEFFQPCYNRFDEFEESVDQLIREYTKKDTVPEGMAKSIILQSSWALILGLYDNVAFSCSDSSSIAALDKFKMTSTNHRVLNLIMAENAENALTFSKKAIRLYDSNEDFLQKYLARCVAEVHVIKQNTLELGNLI